MVHDGGYAFLPLLVRSQPGQPRPGFVLSTKSSTTSLAALCIYIQQLTDRRGHRVHNKVIKTARLVRTCPICTGSTHSPFVLSCGCLDGRALCVRCVCCVSSGLILSHLVSSCLVVSRLLYLVVSILCLVVMCYVCLVLSCLVRWWRTRTPWRKSWTPTPQCWKTGCRCC